jgi:hypothetical protein
MMRAKKGHEIKIASDSSKTSGKSIFREKPPMLEKKIPRLEVQSYEKEAPGPQKSHTSIQPPQDFPNLMTNLSPQIFYSSYLSATQAPS